MAGHDQHQGMVKRAFLRVSKRLGLFWIARRLTRRYLRILGYHGFALGDENKFRPKLFISASIFRARLQTLRRLNYPILRLDEAIRGLRNGGLPRCPVVITIDDGWYSTCTACLPVLQEFQVPATLYATTHHAQCQTPVFRVLMQYLVWKSLSNVATAKATREALVEITGMSSATMQEMAEAVAARIESAAEGMRLLARICAAAGPSLADLGEDRRFWLMTLEEIARLSIDGLVDIQLHTHNHVLPVNVADAMQEIRENRSVLQKTVTGELKHFCYPNGEWSKAHWPALQSMGIETAVTCDPGLNGSHTPRYALHRFLDGDNVSEIEFEAEMTGYTALIRRVRGLLSRPLARPKDIKRTPGSKQPTAA